LGFFIRNSRWETGRIEKSFSPGAAVTAAKSSFDATGKKRRPNHLSLNRVLFLIIYGAWTIGAGAQYSVCFGRKELIAKI
jgi:hypothetical protein